MGRVKIFQRTNNTVFMKHIPDDVFQMILLRQREFQDKTNNRQFGLGQAAIHLLKELLNGKNK
jgi:hypothetical protein